MGGRVRSDAPTALPPAGGSPDRIHAVPGGLRYDHAVARSLIH